MIDEAVSEYSDEASASRNLLKCVESEVVAPSVEPNNLVPAKVKQKKDLRNVHGYCNSKHPATLYHLHSSSSLMSCRFPLK